MSPDAPASPIPRPLELSIAPNINPYASTGSDLLDSQQQHSHAHDQDQAFGDIIVGGTGKQHWAAGIARDIGIALVVGLALRMIWERIG